MLQATFPSPIAWGELLDLRHGLMLTFLDEFHNCCAPSRLESASALELGASFDCRTMQVREWREGEEQEAMACAKRKVNR